MERYSVADARKRFSELLNTAEAGETIVIERHGVKFTLVASAPRSGPRKKNLVIEMDPAVEAGQFTWETDPDGLTFSRRKANS